MSTRASDVLADYHILVPEGFVPGIFHVSVTFSSWKEFGHIHFLSEIVNNQLNCIERTLINASGYIQ